MPKKIGLLLDVDNVIVDHKAYEAVMRDLVSRGVIKVNKDILKVLQDDEFTRRLWKGPGVVGKALKNKAMLQVLVQVERALRSKNGRDAFVESLQRHIPGYSELRKAIDSYRQKTGLRVGVHSNSPRPISRAFARAIGADSVVKKFTARVRGAEVVDDFEMKTLREYFGERAAQGKASLPARLTRWSIPVEPTAELSPFFAPHLFTGAYPATRKRHIQSNLFRFRLEGVPRPLPQLINGIAERHALQGVQPDRNRREFLEMVKGGTARAGNAARPRKKLH